LSSDAFYFLFINFTGNPLVILLIWDMIINESSDLNFREAGPSFERFKEILS